MDIIRKIIIVMLASAGIRIDKINDSRIDALLFIGIGYGIHKLLSEYISFNLALVYFCLLFIIRYIFLFGGFIKGGFSETLIRKYGEEKGWNIYESLTSAMFFQRSLSFGMLLEATQWSLITGTGWIPGDAEMIRYTCIGLGGILAAAGLWINISAAFVIGIDTYYYKDLFLKRAVIDFKVEGPYKYFPNPMYGIGQISSYGAALMAGSTEGLIASCLNQIMMYIFYFVIEKPHIKMLMNASPQILLETPALSKHRSIELWENVSY